MRGITRMLPAALIAASLVLAVACGGGGGDKPSGGQTSSQSGGSNAESVVLNAGDGLRKAADSFKQDVQSVTADYTFDVKSSAVSVRATGQFAFQAPDKMHMTMKMSGGQAGVDLGLLGSIEMLALGDTFYMYMPLTGWLKMTAADMGADAGSLKAMMDSHSPLDFEKLFTQAGGQVQDLGTDNIAGNKYSHYRTSVDLADLAGAVADTLSSTGANSIPAKSLSGPMTMDVWVDQGTQLPYRLSANGSFTIATESATFGMQVDFKDYNRPVTIPAAPKDAKSLSDMFSHFADGAGQATPAY